MFNSTLPIDRAAHDAYMRLAQDAQNAGYTYQGVQIVNDAASSVQQYEIYGDTTWVKTKSTT